jgi:hypothetical protein
MTDQVVEAEPSDEPAAKRIRVKLGDALAIHDPAVLDNLAEDLKAMGNTHAQAWRAIHYLLQRGYHIHQLG